MSSSIALTWTESNTGGAGAAVESAPVAGAAGLAVADGGGWTDSPAAMWSALCHSNRTVPVAMSTSSTMQSQFCQGGGVAPAGFGTPKSVRIRAVSRG